MTIEISEAQRQVLQETRRLDTPAEFNALVAAVRPEMDRVVREVMEPNAAIPVTLTELRDLYLTTSAYAGPLSSRGYDGVRRGYLRDAIRLLDTANTWFSEGSRAGAYRVRSVEEVIKASRPWRERLKAIGAHAFVFEPDIAEQFADVNSSGTLEEEKQDLEELTWLILQHEVRLAAAGLTPELIAQGNALRDEASGRDLLGIIGLRSREEALGLRNRLLTFATLLGREARAAGINACFDDPEARRRFEAASFRDALRRLRPRRSPRADEPGTPSGDAPKAE